MAECTSPPGQRSSAARFGVYQNAAISSALAAQAAGRPSAGSHALVACVFLVITWGLMGMTYRKETVGVTMQMLGLNRVFAKTVVKIGQGVLTVVFLGAISALCKAVLSTDAPKSRSSAQTSPLTPRQQVLIGKQTPQSTPPPRPKPSPSSGSPNVMVPLHPPMFKGSKAGSSSPFSWAGMERRSLLDSVSNGQAPINASPATPVQVSTFSYSSPASSPQEPSFNPWGIKYKKDEIRNEEELENFLVEVENKMVESSGKPHSTPQGLVTPPIRAVGPGPSPNVITTPQSGPGNTTVRSLRISPNAQKSGLSPKKAEGDLPAPFTMEQAIDAFRKLGVYPEIEQWRDGLRQWFSDVLLGPLAQKIDRSHLQVMEAAAKLGVHVIVSPIGGKQDNVTSGQAAMDGSAQEWLTTFAPDEDALIHQFRAFLVNARNASSKPSIFGLTVPQQEVNPLLQECLDAVTEHQRLRALMKGEWVKGLLPQSSVRADYTVQRLRELAEGTCVKKYEFAGTGEVYDKTTKRWTLELPTDAHLLVYLFCALLEHPQWMLHVDPTSHPSTQSGNNPLFIAHLPQKERFPEKYIAVLSTAPSVLHAGACILAVGKQSPPVFALYWDKRLQFSLQGRTALWDAILLLCLRIKVAHGGIVRGINLGGSAFNLLSLLEQRSAEI